MCVRLWKLLAASSTYNEVIVVLHREAGLRRLEWLNACVKWTCDRRHAKLVKILLAESERDQQQAYRHPA